MMLLMNFASVRFLYLASGAACRRSTRARRGMRASSLLRRGLLGSLGSVLRPTPSTIRDAGGVQSATHDVVPHARQILDASAADEHDRVLLQVVALARNVGGHFHLIGEANAGDLPKRRVRLLGRGRLHDGADSTLLRRALPAGQLVLEGIELKPQRRRGRLLGDLLPALSDQLINSRQAISFPCTFITRKAEGGGPRRSRYPDRHGAHLPSTFAAH